jgi:hypothetical protein
MLMACHLLTFLRIALPEFDVYYKLDETVVDNWHQKTHSLLEIEKPCFLSQDIE